GIGFIVRTTGMNRTKQELSRDYQHLSRLWKEIKKRVDTIHAPALIYQESDFGIRSLRDYFTPEMEEIIVDDLETFRKMRIYCKAVAPRNVKMIKLYKGKSSIFDRDNLENQIRAIYRDRVNLKSGGYIVINPTEAMTTIDVNSGRASSKKNPEETAFRTNLEASEEIARQLRLRDLGGLIAVDFIDMRDRKHEAEVEKVFKKALVLDKARIQLSRISRFGILELSRQKKQSTIQEISYTNCPFCKGSGVRPSLEYAALSAFRKIESEAVKNMASYIKVTLPYEIADYLLNQKRNETCKLESLYNMTLNISGCSDIGWEEINIQATGREVAQEMPVEEKCQAKTTDKPQESPPEETNVSSIQVTQVVDTDKQSQENAELTETTTALPQHKRSHRRPRYRRRKSASKSVDSKTDIPQGTEEITTEKEERDNGLLA
ncbi:MAG: ribonuclease E/G, partial [Syntrophales bacterium]|nr:ribonuclease E/G [Syntrophales bacterium]